MNAIKSIFPPLWMSELLQWEQQQTLNECDAEKVPSPAAQLTHREGGGAGQAAADETLVRAGAPPFRGAVRHQSPAERSLGGFGERKGSCDLWSLTGG